MVFSEEDTVFVKVLHQERVESWSEIVYHRVYKQKLVSEEVAYDDCSNCYCGLQTGGCKQIRTSFSCQTVTEKICRMFTQLHSYGFQTIISEG